MSILEEARKIAIVRYRASDELEGQLASNDNLVKSYQNIFKNKKIEYIYVSNEIADPEQSLKKLKDFHPDTIVIIDQRISLTTFFKMTKMFEMDFEDTQFIIHVYGDFVSRLSEWKKLSELYPDLLLNISVASTPQKKIVEAMLKAPVSISVVPYPIEDMGLAKIDGDDLKEKFGFPQDSIVLVYAGRLSFQKNILGLLKVMKIVNEKDSRFKLLICGNYDYKEAGLDGVMYPEGAINVFISKWMSEFDSHQKFIKFIPKKDRKELFSLYQKVNGFISLSLMHTEDYGMAAAEALSCGAPVFLSRWGGHAGFSDLSPDVHYVDIEKNNGKLGFDENVMAKKILEFNFKNFDRLRCQKDFYQNINIEKIAEKISSDVSFEKYQGVSSLGLKAIFDQPLKYTLSTNRNHTIYFGAYWNDPT